jgi:hypothetical protein
MMRAFLASARSNRSRAMSSISKLLEALAASD